jgi:hypothetical protein
MTDNRPFSPTAQRILVNCVFANYAARSSEDSISDRLLTSG